jgi:hypothetical protein
MAPRARYKLRPRCNRPPRTGWGKLFSRLALQEGPRHGRNSRAVERALSNYHHLLRNPNTNRIVSFERSCD